MDMLDQALDSSNVTIYSPDKDSDDTVLEDAVSQGALTIDPNIQYQIRAETGQSGQVTYRVVQISNDDESSQVIGSNSAFNTDEPGSSLLSGPFQGDQSPPQMATTDDRGFTFVNANSLEGHNIATAVSAESISQATMQSNDGPFYVMMSPQDVIQSNQRLIAPRSGNQGQSIEGVRASRDDRRRATHNEVERRRRDKINNWIVQLSKLIPDCTLDLSKQGQLSKSKGGILAKACDYITELRKVNTNMVESVKSSQKEVEMLILENKLLRQQFEEFKHENNLMQSQME